MKERWKCTKNWKFRLNKIQGEGGSLKFSDYCGAMNSFRYSSSSDSTKDPSLQRGDGEHEDGGRAAGELLCVREALHEFHKA